MDLSPCELVARRGDLNIVFRNLLDNAAKYSGSPARIRLELKPTIKSDGLGSSSRTMERRSLEHAAPDLSTLCARWKRTGANETRDRPWPLLGAGCTQTTQGADYPGGYSKRRRD